MHCLRVTLAATDLDAMARYYDGVFAAGLRPLADGLLRGTWLGTPFVLCSNAIAGVDAAQNRLQLEIAVADLAVFCDAVTRHGGTVRDRTDDHATAVDPDGNTLVVHHRPPCT